MTWTRHLSTKDKPKTEKYSVGMRFFIVKFVNIDNKIVFVHTMSRLNMLEKNREKANKKCCFDGIFFDKL